MSYTLLVVCADCGRDINMRSDKRLAQCPHCHAQLPDHVKHDRKHNTRKVRP